MDGRVRHDESNAPATLPDKDLAEKEASKLQKLIPHYVVKNGESILYKHSIDSDRNLIPSNRSKPTRGNLAFETDILVRNKKIPLIVIENDIHKLTMHDILTYSTKAVKLKGYIDIFDMGC